MKKWFNFFFLSFFSHKNSKEGAKRGYTNVFLSFILALVFLWSGFIGGDMLPFGTHYKNSPDFGASAYAVFANTSPDKRIEAKIEDGTLKVKKHSGEYAECLFVNTFENEADRQNYSVNGYSIVVDTRPASALAEVEAYCVSNDGNGMEISYQDYLALSEVAKLNFDFKLRYTGKELVLTDELIEEYRLYAESLNDENKLTSEKLADDLAVGTITKDEYNSAIYELYFVNYYPEITAYEGTSKVPLLRNYYFHQYISQGAKNYLFIFDDYMAGSFETSRGINVSFYGFYSNLEDGFIVSAGDSQEKMYESVDSFIKDSYEETWVLSAYAYMLNTISLVPILALMILIAALLMYSIMRLRGIEGVSSFGAMFKIVGSFVWFSGLLSALFTVIIGFLFGSAMINMLPLVLFFAALLIRSVVFVIKENRIYKNQPEKQEA